MIIFDCDGVLVDTELVSNRIFAEMLTEAGYPVTTEEAIRQFKGGRIRTIVPQLDADHNLGLPDDWLEQFYARQFEALGIETKAIPGIEDVLDRLDAKGVPFCVASQAQIAKMRITLGVSGLWSRFEGRIFSADMVERPKPYPDLFLHAAKTMGWDPEKVTVVEDSTTGIRAAVAAGMRAVGFDEYGDGSELAAVGAHETTSSMEEVWAIIDR